MSGVVDLRTARVEAVLREAAAGVAWPATPDLAGVVAARIAGEGLRPTVGTGIHLPGLRSPVRLGRPAALALGLLLLLAAIAAAAAGLRVAGVRIVFLDASTTPLPSAWAALDLGRPVSLDEVRGLESPRVLVPTDERFARPDAVYRSVRGTGTTVSLAWSAGSDLPSIGPTGLTLVVNAMPGAASENLLQKAIRPGTTVEPVEVGGLPGWWISGDAHELLIVGPDGSVVVADSRLAGDTLLYARGGTVYRIESALGRDRTIEVAESMR